MFCPAGQVVLIHSDQFDQTCPSILIFSFSSELTSIVQKRGMDSLNPEFSLNGSKNEHTRTVTVFFPLSDVSNRAVVLVTNIKLGQNSICDKTFFCDKLSSVTKLKLGQNSNCDNTQNVTQLKLWQPLSVKKLKLWQNSNCDKTENCTKTKIVIKP